MGAFAGRVAAVAPAAARSNVAVYVVLIGVAALIASAVVAWLVLQSPR